MQPDALFRRTTSLRPTYLLASSAAGLGMLVLCCAAWLLFDSRRAAYDGAIRSAENILLGLEHDIRLTVESLDLSLKAAANGARIPELEALRPAVRQAVLFDGAVAGEAYGGLVVTDETGRVTYDSVAVATRAMNLSTRPFFAAHRDGPGHRLLVSGPVRSRLNGGWALVLSRRIDHADGSFAGIVAGTVQLDPIQRLFSAMSIGARSSITLFTLEGRVLARIPEVEGSIGRDFTGSTLFNRIVALRDAPGTAVLRSGPSQIDEVDRVVVYRRIGALPLGITYGMPESDIYAGWGERAVVVVLVLTLFAALATVLAWGLRRELVRRSRAERTAQAIASQTRLLTDNASDLLLHLDWDSTCRFVSPACERLLGYGPAQLLGRPWLDLVHPEDQLALTSSLLELQLGDSDSPALYRVRHNDGPWRHMEAHGRALPASPIRILEPDPPPGAIIALRDITDRVLFEAKLRQAHRMEALGQITAGVAHDFNNMLQAQLGCLELLQDELADEPEPLRLADQALTLGERGARLTSQLLSFSRQQLLCPEPIPLEQFLSALAETLRRTLGPNVRLTAKVEPGASAPYADRAHLESALLNLAINARDAMPGGGTIQIEGHEEPGGAGGPRIALTMRDTGMGMDAATLERACEPFFTTKGANGTGLGLASVQGFVTQSGGSLRIDSAPGQGTTIRILLPTTQDPPLSLAGSTRPVDCHGRLLLVDDTADVLVIIGAFLRGAGFEVVEALGPEAALERLDDGGPFDCLVTDYAMPSMNGGELISHAQRSCPGLPALVITGWAELDDLEQLAGRAEVLRKPFKRDELQRQVVRLIARAEASRPTTLLSEEN